MRSCFDLKKSSQIIDFYPTYFGYKYSILFTFSTIFGELRSDTPCNYDVKLIKMAEKIIQNKILRFIQIATTTALRDAQSNTLIRYTTLKLAVYNIDTQMDSIQTE